MKIRTKISRLCEVRLRWGVLCSLAWRWIKVNKIGRMCMTTSASYNVLVSRHTNNTSLFTFRCFRFEYTFFSHSINRHSRFHSVELMANGWFRSAHVHFIHYTLCRHLECSIPSIRSLYTYILYFSVDAMACLSFQNHLSNQQHSSKCANKLPFLPIVIVTK